MSADPHFSPKIAPQTFDAQGNVMPEADHAGDSAIRQCFAFLRAVPIFQGIDDDVLWELAQVGREEIFAPGSRVVNQGENLDDKRFYIVRSGSADVIRANSWGIERAVARIASGGYFGELGLLTNQPRNATVQVHGDWPLTTYSFDAMTFHRTIAVHVVVFQVVRERRRTRHQLAAVGVDPIDSMEMFRSMPLQEREFVLADARQEWADEGEDVVVQGEAGDRFYVILDGEIDVIKDGKCIVNLGPGTFFGETALLFDVPRTATCQAAQRTLLWSISLAAFQKVICHYLLAHAESRQTISQRLRSIM